MNIYESIIGGYKDKASGAALAKFLREVDTVSTDIGDIRDGFSGGPKYLIVTGVMVGKGDNNISTVLRDASNITIQLTEKFKDIGDRTSVAILKEYIEESGSTDGEELLDKLKSIIKNKRVIMPIKIGMPCQVVFETDDKTRLMKKNTIVVAVQWSINKDSGLMEGIVVTEPIDTITGRQVTINIEEYGKRLFLTDIERACKDTIKGIETTMEITRNGYIKPVQFIGKFKTVVDNCFMYCNKSGKMEPIAYWGAKNELCGQSEFKDFTKTKDYKEIKKYLEYIGKHRKYIGPAFMTESKDIEI